MNDERWFKKLENDGILRDELASLGWALWLFGENGENFGYLDEHLLRKLADEIEKRNKPFWDEYEKYQQAEMAREEQERMFEDDIPF